MTIRRPQSIVIDHEPEIVSVASTIMPTSDAFAEMAGMLPAISGGFLKHDGMHGGWMCDGAAILDTDLWAAVNVRRGFKYLEAGRRSENYPCTPGAGPKARSDIPHHIDQSLWPVIDGQPQDPVKEYAALDFIKLADGTFCTYEALNKTGRRAVAELVRRIAWQRGPHGSMAKAVLKLGTRLWQQGTRANYIPTFEIVSWVVPDGQGGMRLESDADRPTLREQLNDHNP